MTVARTFSLEEGSGQHDGDTVVQDVWCSRCRRRCRGCRLRCLWCRCWAGDLESDPARLDAVVGEVAYDIEQGGRGYILVAGLVVDVDGDRDALQERLGLSSF